MNYMTNSDVRSLSFSIRVTWGAPAVWRMDAPTAYLMGRMQGWRERLNRMVFAARTWEGLETIARRQARVLANRRVRCEVYEANNGSH